MNDTAQIIIAVATLITSVGTIILGIVNRQTALKIEKQTNGLLSELKDASKREGIVQGTAEGRASEIQFQRDHSKGE